MNYENIYFQNNNEYKAGLQYGYKSVSPSGLILDFSLGFNLGFINKFTSDKIDDYYLTTEDFEENKKSFFPFFFIAKMRAGWNFKKN